MSVIWLLLLVGICLFPCVVRDFKKKYRESCYLKLCGKSLRPGLNGILREFRFFFFQVPKGPNNPEKLYFSSWSSWGYTDKVSMSPGKYILVEVWGGEFSGEKFFLFIGLLYSDPRLRQARPTSPLSP